MHRIACSIVVTLFLGCQRGGAADPGAPSGACPPGWLQAPALDPSIAVPGGRVVAHAVANGTQNYVCGRAPGDGGEGHAWTFVGPEATLSDCRAVLIGRHFASDGGAPQWQMLDGAYVVGHKVAASTPDGGAGSIPWLLLAADREGGSGPLSEARYIQRVNTSGGASPGAACDATRAGATQKVPYTADYFFFARE
jgi:uncharacterized protein DUF3455